MGINLNILNSLCMFQNLIHLVVFFNFHDLQNCFGLPMKTNVSYMMLPPTFNTNGSNIHIHFSFKSPPNCTPSHNNGTFSKQGMPKSPTLTHSFEKINMVKGNVYIEKYDRLYMQVSQSWCVMPQGPIMCILLLAPSK